MNENIIVPPPLHPLIADRNRGRGRPDLNNRKNSDKGVFFFCFFLQLYFFTVQKGRNINRGVGGVQILISIETYIICDFSGGGGSGPPIPLWIRVWVRNK